MKHILVYGDSLSWGIIPNSRGRLPFEQRWPGVMEIALISQGLALRVAEDAINGRRTIFDDPFRPGRNGLHGIGQVMERHSPLDLVILMLGTNDFQSVHLYNASHSARGIGILIEAIRHAPIEPGMPVPDILVISPPLVHNPKGVMAERFAGYESKIQGLPQAIEQVAATLDCRFFDAGKVVSVSLSDGVHLDREEHIALGKAVAAEVKRLLWE